MFIEEEDMCVCARACMHKSNILKVHTLAKFKVRCALNGGREIMNIVSIRDTSSR